MVDHRNVDKQQRHNEVRGKVDRLDEGDLRVREEWKLTWLTIRMIAESNAPT